jgi:hypothetical protein
VRRVHQGGIQEGADLFPTLESLVPGHNDVGIEHPIDVLNESALGKVGEDNIHHNLVEIVHWQVGLVPPDLDLNQPNLVLVLVKLDPVDAPIDFVGDWHPVNLTGGKRGRKETLRLFRGMPLHPDGRQATEGINLQNHTPVLEVDGPNTPLDLAAIHNGDIPDKAVKHVERLTLGPTTHALIKLGE